MIEVDEYTHEPFPSTCDMCGGPGPCIYAVRGGRYVRGLVLNRRGHRAKHYERTIRCCGEGCREAAEVALSVEFSDLQPYAEEESLRLIVVPPRRPAQ